MVASNGKEQAPITNLNPDQIDFSKNFEDEAKLAAELNQKKKETKSTKSTENKEENYLDSIAAYISQYDDYEQDR